MGPYAILKQSIVPASRIQLAWDLEKQRPLLLRMCPKETEEMIGRGQRAFELFHGLSCENCLPLVAWQYLAASTDAQDSQSSGHYMIKEYRPGSYLKWILPSMEEDRENLTAPFTCRETAHVLIHIARALENLHEHAIVHRGLTPLSIFLDYEGKAWLGNFFLAKLERQDGLFQTGQTFTQQDVPLGFLNFMAPEQLDNGAEVDHSCDLWACGILAFYLLTKRTPFSRGSNATTAKAIHEEDPYLDIEEIPLGIQKIIARCLAKDPDHRYENARKLREDWENFYESTRSPE